MDLNKILNNADALTGLGYADVSQTAELLGAIHQLPREKQVEVFQKIVRKGVPVGGSVNQSSRDKAASRIGALPKHLQAGLAQGTLQLADTLFYVVKAVGGALSISMLQGTDTTSPATGNIAFQKLENDAWFLCTEIGILSGVDAAPANASYAVAAKAILNGTFEFKANSKYMMPKDTSCQIFDTTNQNNVRRGVIELHSPKWIEPLQAITMDIKFSQAAEANENIKFVMLGQSVIPY